VTPPNTLSHLVSVDRLPNVGREIVVEATEEQRRALAESFGLPAIERLIGRFHVTGGLKRAKVRGEVVAKVTRTCVVTLDPFEEEIGEKVDLEFTEETREPTSNAELREIDPPDEIVSGKIDLGAVMAEFLALGLDPHPRKPGVSFEAVAPEGVADSPFAALGKLKGEP
jgi:uncharacterized metal-binding protein YceD (DUF177 family)